MSLRTLIDGEVIGINEVFRPTRAEPVGNALFKVLQTSNYNPQDEKWEFVPSSLVECERRKLEGEQELVAVKAHWEGLRGGHEVD